MGTTFHWLAPFELQGAPQDTVCKPLLQANFHSLPMRAPRPRRRSESLHQYCLSDVEICLGSDTLTYFTELPSENLTQFVYAFICVSKCLCPLKLGHCLISDSNCGKEWLLCPGLRGNRLNPPCLSYPVIVFDCIHLRSSNRKRESSKSHSPASSSQCEMQFCIG